MNSAFRLLFACVFCAAALLPPVLHAESAAALDAQAGTLKLTRLGDPIGLHLGRSSHGMRCELLPVCAGGDHYMRLWGRGMLSETWGAELGLLEAGRLDGAGGSSRVQGVSLSVVRRFSVLDSVSAYGRLGTTYGHTDTTAAAGSGARQGGENGFGLSWGAGLSWQVSPRLSARVEWDRSDFRFVDGSREVRATSLGLQWRY